MEQVVNAARLLVVTGVVALIFGCGGTGVEPVVVCPSMDWGLGSVGEIQCAGRPTVGEPFAVGIATPVLRDDGTTFSVASGVEVDVLAIGEVTDAHGVRGHTTRIRHADGEGTLHSSTLTPWFGDVTVGGRETRFALGRDVDGLLFTVGTHSLRLTLPDAAQGAVRVAVDRWGDAVPLFRVSVGESTAAPFAAVVVESAGLRQISDPNAHEHAPVIAADDPDCTAATPVELVSSPPVHLRDLQIPAFRNEAAGPAVCAVVGAVDSHDWVVCSAGERQVAFIVDGPDRWRRVTCGSDPMLELDRSLQFAGITVVEEPTLAWLP